MDFTEGSSKFSQLSSLMSWQTASENFTIAVEILFHLTNIKSFVKFYFSSYIRSLCGSCCCWCGSRGRILAKVSPHFSLFSRLSSIQSCDLIW